MLNYIEEKDYDMFGQLDDEQDVLDRFYEYESSDSYISDVITEIADGAVPIYTKEIWEGAYDIQEYIEEAIAEGLCDTGRDVDLTKIMMAGYYQYYSSSLYNNLETLVYTYIARAIDEHIDGLSEEITENMAMDELEGRIEEEASKIDNDNKIGDIRIAIGLIMEDIKEGLFDTEE